MPFNLKYLQTIGATSRAGDEDNTQNSAQCFSYEHPTDTIADMSVAGYFNEVRDIVESLDMIFMNSSNTETFTIKFFETVPKSPLKTDVTLDASVMNAT